MTRQWLSAVVRLATCLIAACLIVESAAAQQRKPVEPPNPWLVRAETLTGEALEDEWRLPTELYPVLPARLAAVWWNADPGRAHAWLKQAVDQVTRVSPTESDSLRTDRLDAARLVFQIAAPLDKTEADRVRKMLTEEARRDVKDPAKGKLANRIGNSLGLGVMNLGKSDPQSIYEVGRTLLELRQGSQFGMLLIPLHVRSVPLYTQLFTEALASVRTDYDWTLLFMLSQEAFPAFTREHLPEVPVELQIGLLNVVAEGLLRAPKDDEDRTSICRLSQVGQRLINDFPPAQAGMVQQVIQNCRAQGSESSGGFDDARALKTADDCLKAAAKASKPGRSAQLKQLAAIRAQQEEHDPLRAIDILLSLTAEEREWLPNWKGQLDSPLIDALEMLYKRHDTQGIQQVFDRIPDEIRAQSELNFAAIIASSDQPFAMMMLGEARRTLERFDPDDGHTYTALLSAYVRTIPEDAPQVLKSVMTGLNRIHFDDLRDFDCKTKTKVCFIYTSPAEGLRPLGTDAAALLENNEDYVRASIKLLDNAREREAFRLGFIAGALRRYEQEKAKPKKPESPVKAATASAK